MAETVTMPQLGESVVEGTIAKWLKQPGERVARYEMIVSVVTDKVDTEIPSPAEGIMGELIAAEGAVVAVGEPICTIETSPVAAAAAPPLPVESPVIAEEAPSQAADVAAPAAPPRLVNGQAAAAAAGSERLHLTPAVRMLARQHGVDLHELAGSGFGGRITKKDVLDHVEQRDRADSRSRPSLVKVLPDVEPGGETVVPLTPVRKMIAEHMVRSVQTSPHAWMMMEVDMTPVVQLRASLRDEFRKRHGVSLTFLPFVARAVVDGLRRFPSLNSTWSEAGIVLKHDINLGIAIALEDNLIVPVIRNADRLTVTGLATTMSDLAERARTKRLSPDEMRDGTFTLNNTGSLGTVLSQPIINQPQAAILAMDSIVKRPVVVAGASVRSGAASVGGSDAIAVRSMMNLCISFDHRINDGLSATRFLKAVKETLETIDPTSSLA